MRWLACLVLALGACSPDLDALRQKGGDSGPPDGATSDRGAGDLPAGGDAALDANGDAPLDANGDAPLVDGDGDALASDSAPDRAEVAVPEDAAGDTGADGPPADAAVDATAPDLPPDAPPPDGPAPDLAPMPLPPGAACTVDEECTTGHCVGQVCCNSTCPAEDPTTCGRTGACNGQGACVLHPASTQCLTPTCSAAGETPAGTCDGQGMCLPGTTRDCGTFACTGTVCATACMSVAQCKPGNACDDDGCIAPPEGPVLYWRFDEPAGDAAAQDSGVTGGAGTFRGDQGLPTPSTPPFPGFVSSRRFVAASRHAVQLSPIPAQLKPTFGLTLAAWYRAGTTDSAGSELISAGNNYLLRLRRNGLTGAISLEAVKHVGGLFANVSCASDDLPLLDQQWHHVAAVIGQTEMLLFLDGVVKSPASCSGDSRTVVYDQGADLWVGRQGDGGTANDFDGEIDEVRIYARALTAAQVMALAQRRK